MLLHDPGLLTRTIPAIVIPRNTSSEISRSLSCPVLGDDMIFYGKANCQFADLPSLQTWLQLRIWISSQVGKEDLSPRGFAAFRAERLCLSEQQFGIQRGYASFEAQPQGK